LHPITPGTGANHHSFGLSNEPGQPLGIIQSSMILKKLSSLTYHFLCNKEAIRTLSNSQRLGNMGINTKIIFGDQFVVIIIFFLSFC
jgi:hypothetical protein